MGNFRKYLSGRCKMRNGNKDFCFIYHANDVYPSAFITVDDMLLFDMNGSQIGCVNDDGYFYKLNSYSTPVAFYDESTDSICDSNGGDFVGVVETNRYPFFNVQRPSFPFDSGACRVYNAAIGNGTGPVVCSGRLSTSKKFIQLF